MSFDWLDYLRLAQFLTGVSKNSPGQEANFRAAVSRAYYAAFCKARNYLRDVDKDSQVTGTRDIHGYVLDQFMKSPDKIRGRIAINLERLRRYRNMADYDDTMTINQANVLKTLKQAEQVIADLDSLGDR
jgi:uncharacterized protein (UPF0332 family)